MRSIGVVTTSRSDYSSCLPLLRAIEADPQLELHLIVSGMHLSSEFGYTVKEVEADGFQITDRVAMLLSSDTPEGIAKSIGMGTIGFAQSLARMQPDILILVGDRLELLSVACTALPFGVPMAHISGGDVTEGAVDNQVRHALTKMSHLHFVAMEAHAKRVQQMGEEPWRIFVTGDPALDLIHQIEFLSREELADSLGLELTPPLLVITLHPTTLGTASAIEQAEALLAALNRVQGTLVFTYPNADVENREIIERFQAFVAQHPGTKFFPNLGQQRYYSLLSQADLMVGNSSSGIWEAPSFRLPVVNIGDRQKGRIRARNVIDLPFDADAIYRGIQRGLKPNFRASLEGLQNPYGDGQATQRIMKVLKQIDLDARLLQKRFVDYQSGVFRQCEE